MQVAAMQEQVGCAVARLGIREIELAKMLTGIPCAVAPGSRSECDAPQVRLQPQRCHHSHGVRAHLDAGADAVESPCLLVDVHPGAPAGQEPCQRKPADSPPMTAMSARSVMTRSPLR